MTTTPLGAVFLDRDGTIIHEVNYLSRLQDIKLLPLAAAAIARLNRQLIPVILVTNQSGVARGKFTEDFVKQSHVHLNQLLAAEGARIDDFFYCPHHPEAGFAPYKMSCRCRKPAPGMLLEAAEKHHLTLDKSYVIGDKLIDVELGLEAGGKGILVETGYGLKEKERIEECNIRPDKVCPDLSQAVEWILKQQN
ncbi:HAD family hydrolase [bacterium]|nr:HAD family hydrolase [bacterium]